VLRAQPPRPDARDDVAGPLELIGDEAIPELGVVGVDVDDGVQQVSLPPAELVQTTFGGRPDVRERLQELFRDIGPDELSQDQRLIDNLLRHGMADALARNVGDLEEWATQLRGIANA
jgi:hypothetical protein